MPTVGTRRCCKWLPTPDQRRSRASKRNDQGPPQSTKVGPPAPCGRHPARPPGRAHRPMNVRSPLCMWRLGKKRRARDFQWFKDLLLQHIALRFVAQRLDQHAECDKAGIGSSGSDGPANVSSAGPQAPRPVWNARCPVPWQVDEGAHGSWWEAVFRKLRSLVAFADRKASSEVSARRASEWIRRPPSLARDKLNEPLLCASIAHAICGKPQ